MQDLSPYKAKVLALADKPVNEIIKTMKVRYNITLTAHEVRLMLTAWG